LFLLAGVNKVLDHFANLFVVRIQKQKGPTLLREFCSLLSPRAKELLDHFANFVFEDGFDYFGALAIAFGHGFHKVNGLLGSNVPR
jgi:hypothetical protein